MEPISNREVVNCELPSITKNYRGNTAANSLNHASTNVDDIEQSHKDKDEENQKKIHRSIANNSIARIFGIRSKDKETVDRSLCYVKRRLDREQSDFSKNVYNNMKQKSSFMTRSINMDSTSIMFSNNPKHRQSVQQPMITI
jgi:hypothetical protein